MTAPTATGECVIFVPFIGAMGGVERLLLSLSRYLHERGRSHGIVTFRDDIGLAKFATWPLPVHQLLPRRTVPHEMLALRRHLAARSPHGSVLVFDLKGAFYAAAATVPFVVHLTDPPSMLRADVSKDAPSLRGESAQRTLIRLLSSPRRLRGELAHRLNRRGARRARAVIVMTTLIADEVRRLYDVQPVLARPGIARAPKRPTDAEPAPGHRIELLSVSRLEPSKRITWILEALGALDDAVLEGRQWTLHVVGDGSEAASLRALAASLYPDHQVIFHGGVDDARLEALYAHADLFLMPAVQGWGLPALEALARGIPVVMHQDSGVAEILSATPWVECVREAGAKALAKGVNRMVWRITSGQLSSQNHPEVPTDTHWARQLSMLCEWE